MNPLVSIIIPLFNREKFIYEALSSVLAQNYANWECIVVDDGSSDNSESIVSDFHDDDIRFSLVRRSREPKGANTCRNIGLEKSKGKYIVFLDSDDLLASHCLERRVDFMENHPELDFAVFNTLVFYETPGDSDVLLNIKTDTNDIDRHLYKDPPWITTGPIWKVEALVNLSGFDEKLVCYQEFDLHLRALINEASYIFLGESQPDNFHRISHENRISNDSGKSMPFMKSRRYSYLKTARMLKKRGMLTSYRKKLLANLFLEMIRENMWNKMIYGESLFDSLKWWTVVRKENWLSFFDYLVSLLHVFVLSSTLLYKIPSFHLFLQKVTKRMNKSWILPHKDKYRMKIEYRK